MSIYAVSSNQEGSSEGPNKRCPVARDQEGVVTTQLDAAAVRTGTHVLYARACAQVAVAFELYDRSVGDLCDDFIEPLTIVGSFTVSAALTSD